MLENVLLTPVLPSPWFQGLVILALLLGFVSLWRDLLGGCARLAVIGCLLLLCARPSIIHQDISPLPNIALVMTDVSASQQLGTRPDINHTARQTLLARLQSIPNLEIRDESVGGVDETALVSALSQALASIPRSQLAGVFVISDGQISDAQISSAANLGLSAPLHHLISGHAREFDRKLTMLHTPRFGIVGDSVALQLQVDDFGRNMAKTAMVTIAHNGKVIAQKPVRIGEKATLHAHLEQPGYNLFEITTPALSGELTRKNNKTTIELSAIRDRLRVLLVSGEPHAGERVWRNLLKSDPAVDLIHFTILKPIGKRYVAKQSELALIQFPDNTLFLEKLPEFDVLIFDRYTYRNVLNSIHFDSIAQYVRNGGAILIASGPEFVGTQSLSAQPSFAPLLPAFPTGRIIEKPFTPLVSATGIRHPVTAPLHSADSAPPDWGRWLRVIDVDQKSGHTPLVTPDGAPLLILDRVEKGRVALLLSDHIWLWARGFDGGGPHRELLRRLVHWLMQEPGLEEEALRANITKQQDAHTLTVTRHSLQGEITDAQIIQPDGQKTSIALKPTSPGIWQINQPVSKSGVYHISAYTEKGVRLDTTVTLGMRAPPEYQDVVATTHLLAPIVASSGGVHYPLVPAYQQKKGSTIPTIRMVKSGYVTSARRSRQTWLWLIDQRAGRVDRVSSNPVLPPFVWLILVLGCLLLGWCIERSDIFPQRR